MRLIWLDLWVGFEFIANEGGLLAHQGLAIFLNATNPAPSTEMMGILAINLDAILMMKFNANISGAGPMPRDTLAMLCMPDMKLFDASETSSLENGRAR